MLYSRVSSGLDFLDASIGGIYSNRSYHVRGPSQSGRTTFALQFLLAGIENGEPGIMISSDRIENVILKAEAMGISLEPYLMDNRLILMEYPKVILGRKYTFGTIVQLLGEVEQYIDHYNCSRLTLDTLHPLLIAPREPQLVNYVYSLMNSLEALNVTTLVTTGVPNSQAAQRIIQLIEDSVVGSFVLSVTGGGDTIQRRLSVHKMVDRMNPPLHFQVKIEHGEGIVQDMELDQAKPERARRKKAAMRLNELPLHIGVLDDDENTVEMIEDIFHKESIINSYASESELRSHIMGMDCDLFVINAGMPGLDWRRTVMHLREMYPKLPIFLVNEKRTTLLTGQIAKKAGADALFIKPIIPDDILKAFEKTLTNYGTMEELIERRGAMLEPGSLPVDLDPASMKTEGEEAEEEPVNLLSLPEFKSRLGMQIWRGRQEQGRFALVSFKMVYISEISKLPHLPQGLELVRRVAQVVTASLRGINDTASRYMDKIVVLLEDTNRDGARAFANRVISELKSELESQLGVQIGKHLNILTAISTYPEEGETVDELISQVTDVSRNFIKLHG